MVTKMMVKMRMMVKMMMMMMMMMIKMRIKIRIKMRINTIIKMTIKRTIRMMTMTMNDDDDDQVPCLLPRWQLLPLHPRRHALRCHRLCRILLGIIIINISECNLLNFDVCKNLIIDNNQAEDLPCTELQTIDHHHPCHCIVINSSSLPLSSSSLSSSFSSSSPSSL